MDVFGDDNDLPIVIESPEILKPPDPPPRARPSNKWLGTLRLSARSVSVAILLLVVVAFSIGARGRNHAPLRPESAVESQFFRPFPSDIEALLRELEGLRQEKLQWLAQPEPATAAKPVSPAPTQATAPVPKAKTQKPTVRRKPASVVVVPTPHRIVVEKVVTNPELLALYKKLKK
jgi:hypothetical protein